MVVRPVRETTKFLLVVIQRTALAGVASLAGRILSVQGVPTRGSIQNRMTGVVFAPVLVPE
jgi:hypothetical protein